MPGEMHFFDDVYSRAKELGDPTDRSARLAIAQRLHTIYDRFYEPEDQQRITRLFPAAQDLAKALEGCTGYGAVLDRFMRLQMRAAGKQRWGNNAPRDLFSVRDIRTFFPDARLVICVRDIRAFLYSYQGKWKVTSAAHVERLKKLYHPVVSSYLWKSSMQQLPLLEATIPEADRIVVRYEDLVTEPERTVRSICGMIGEDFEPAMLEIEGHNSSSAGETTGIFFTSVDRWKTELSPEEIAIGQAIAGRLLERLGYAVLPVRVRRARWLVLWLGTPFALVRALHANRATRGPLLPYLYRRVGCIARHPSLAGYRNHVRHRRIHTSWQQGRRGIVARHGGRDRASRSR